jgi:hypothetical protein
MVGTLRIPVRQPGRLSRSAAKQETAFVDGHCYIFVFRSRMIFTRYFAVSSAITL